MGRTIRLLTGVVMLVVLFACAGPEQAPPPEDDRLPRLEGRIDRLEEKLEETRTLLPVPPGFPLGEPQQGTPVPVDDTLLRKRAPGDEDGGCPVLDYELVNIRAEIGNSCPTYAAEIASFVALCVDECDETGCCARAIRLAAGACAEWCQQKNCGQRVSFVPPPRCAASDCYEQPEKCPADCVKKQWCSLLSTNRVFNCFCRDVILD